MLGSHVGMSVLKGTFVPKLDQLEGSYTVRQPRSALVVVE